MGIMGIMEVVGPELASGFPGLRPGSVGRNTLFNAVFNSCYAVVNAGFLNNS